MSNPMHTDYVLAFDFGGDPHDMCVSARQFSELASSGLVGGWITVHTFDSSPECPNGKRDGEECDCVLHRLRAAGVVGPARELAPGIVVAAFE